MTNSLPVNEILLIASLIAEFSMVVLLHKLFGKTGLYAFIVFSSIAANIEVLMLVKAFGLEMTLGNILFAANFLATDILSEKYGKDAAKKGVWLGVITTVFFIVVSGSWLLYKSSGGVGASEFRQVFANTPRVMLAGLAVYAIVNRLDVFLYHLIWKKTTERTGSSKARLWLRNNAATLISQLVNAFLFNICAFAGIYDWKTVLMVALSSYLIFIVTSLADTPFVYWARKIRPIGEKTEE